MIFCISLYFSNWIASSQSTGTCKYLWAMLYLKPALGQIIKLEFLNPLPHNWQDSQNDACYSAQNQLQHLRDLQHAGKNVERTFAFKSWHQTLTQKTQICRYVLCELGKVSFVLGFQPSKLKVVVLVTSFCRCDKYLREMASKRKQLSWMMDSKALVSGMIALLYFTKAEAGKSSRLC